MNEFHHAPAAKSQLRELLFRISVALKGLHGWRASCVRTVLPSALTVGDASANPGGRGGLYHKMQRLAHEFTLEATRYLIRTARIWGGISRCCAGTRAP